MHLHITLQDLQGVRCNPQAFSGCQNIGDRHELPAFNFFFLERNFAVVFAAINPAPDPAGFITYEKGVQDSRAQGFKWWFLDVPRLLNFRLPGPLLSKLPLRPGQKTHITVRAYCLLVTIYSPLAHDPRPMTLAPDPCPLRCQPARISFRSGGTQRSPPLKP